MVIGRRVNSGGMEAMARGPGRPPVASDERKVILPQRVKQSTLTALQGWMRRAEDDVGPVVATRLSEGLLVDLAVEELCRQLEAGEVSLADILQLPGGE